MTQPRKMLFTVLIAAATAATAQDAAAPATPFTAGWYVAPMLTYMSPDSARCNVDGDLGGSLAFGHRGDFGALEVWGQFLSLSHGGCSYTVPDGPDDGSERDPVTEPAGTVKLNGGGLALVVGPFFEQEVLSRFFGMVGFGVLLREDHPQYPKDVTTIFGDAGVGYLQPFELFGWRVNARADLRYRYDVQQPPNPDEQDPAPAHEYGDVIFNLGLQIPLARAQPQVAEAAPAPVAVVPVAFTDSDNDGVIDERDQCPETPANSLVNNVGCPGTPEAPPPPPAAEPAALETAKAGDTFVLKGVTFESGKSRLRADSKTILDTVAEALVKRPELKVEVGGHTDDRGSDSSNLALSQRRADSVMTYLVERGVGSDRLTAVGYGEAQPVDTNESDEGRERNRRVELKVLE